MKHLRIVLIEDNAGDARLIMEELGQTVSGDGTQEISIEVFNELHKGLSRLKRGATDIVLLDLSLPDSQGLETIKTTRNAAPDTPIVVLTGLDDETLALNAVREGAQDYLVKEQIDRDLLIHSIRYAIERHRLLAELSGYAASLQASEKQYKTILRTTIDGFLLIDSDGGLLDVNEAYCHLLGYSRDELLDKSFYDLELDDADKISGRIKETVARGWDRFETRQRHRSGSPVDLEISINYIDINGGRFIAFARDITTKKRAAEFNETLSKIEVGISTILNEDEILRNVVAEAAPGIGAETAFIALRENDHWVIRHVYNLNEKIINNRFTGKEMPQMDEAIRTKYPVVINDAEHDNRVDAATMREYGVKSLCVVPIPLRRTSGVLQFNYTTRVVPFDEAQVGFADKLSDAISLALENARLYEKERAIADTLQEALLSLPSKISGIEFGCLYRTATVEASRVGGDFYDLFPLEGPEVGIVVGDVSGKGLEAATLTSMVKDAIRAYSNLDRSPSSILSKTNGLLVKFSQSPFSFVTIFFAMLNFETGQLRYCCAGHPPPFIVRSDNRLLRLSTSSPATGAVYDFAFQDECERMGGGDVLVIYTDGVTEAHFDHELFGERRLADTLTSLSSPGNVEGLPQEIFNAISSFSNGQLADDIVVLSVALERSRGSISAA